MHQGKGNVMLLSVIISKWSTSSVQVLQGSTKQQNRISVNLSFSRLLRTMSMFKAYQVVKVRKKLTMVSAGLVREACTARTQKAETGEFVWVEGSLCCTVSFRTAAITLKDSVLEERGGSGRVRGKTEKIIDLGFYVRRQFCHFPPCI